MRINLSKRIIASALSVFLLLAFSITFVYGEKKNVLDDDPLQNQSLSEAESDFNSSDYFSNDEVILRVGIVSDAQSLPNESRGITQYRKALNIFKEKGIDILIDAGDTSDEYDPLVWQEYKNVFDTVFSGLEHKPEMIVSMGNHEYYGAEDKEYARQQFNEIFEKDSSNEHKEINGYHFINITSYDEYCLYTQETLDWLQNEVEAAVNQSPGKPVFVIGHPHIKTTVYGSDAGWGNDQLYEVLKNYESVVYISGHSHFPLTDERSIHQRDFTCVGTASMQYLELEGGKIQGIHPNGIFSQSQVMYMEIYADRVEFTKIDLETGEKLKNNWVIASDLQKENFVYTDDRKNQRTAPVFPENSTIAVTDVDANGAEVTFTAAVHDDFTHSYRIKAINSITGKTDLDYLMFSDFYLGIEKMKTELSCELFGLQEKTEYIVEISAIESFGNESVPISTVFTTGSDVVFEMEMDETGVYDISGNDFSVEYYGNPIVQNGVNGFDYNLFLDGNSYVKIGIDTAEFEKISQGFAFETVFSVEELGTVQEVFGNAEMGGVCLEISQQGDLQFWAWSEDTYSYVIASEKIEPGREYHCICTYDGTALILYLNGILSDSVPMSGNVGFRDGMSFILGADPNYDNVCASYFGGTISDFVIYGSSFDYEKAKNAYNVYVNESGDKINEILELNISGECVSDVSQFNTNFDTKGNVGISFDNYLNRNVLDFNGEGYIETSMSNYQINSISNSFTIETVFCIDDFSQTMDVFANTELSGIGLESSERDKIGLWVWSDERNQYVIIDTDVYAGEYCHYIAVYDGSEIVVYINGRQAQSADFIGRIGYNNTEEIPFLIGADPQRDGSAVSYFKGTLAMLKIEKSPVTSEEALQRYHDFEASLNPQEEQEYREKLLDLCTVCESINAEEYTEDSYNNLLPILEKSKKILDKEYDEQEYKSAYEELQKAFESLEKREEEYKMGDVNRDGTINIVDATTIQMYIANLPCVIDLQLADMDKNGIVNIEDVTIIQKLIANVTV